jgi:DNA (cytosine-5)-methyltransferase 3A
MSCGQIALRELGVKYQRYYASETDSHAIRQTQLNFPCTVMLGDIEGWRTWDIDWASVDLVLSGTPCTGFSVAGKHLAFDDPGSRLFFVFADILNHVREHNPEALFLFENVRMKKKYLHIISETLGVFPVLINSALVSAQNRRRYYWSNIRTRREGLFGWLHTDIPQPADRGVLLRDILEENADDKYRLPDISARRILSAVSREAISFKAQLCIIEREWKSYDGNVTPCILKSPTLTTRSGESCATLVFSAGEHPSKSVIIQRPGGNNKGARYELKSPALTANSREQNNLVVQLNPSVESGGVQPCQQNRVYDINHKSPALMAQMSSGAHAIYKSGLIRRLTPTECARLQTVPSWYKWECSDHQAYRMTGAGWTVEVIKHILSYMTINNSLKQMKP